MQVDFGDLFYVESQQDAVSAILGDCLRQSGRKRKHSTTSTILRAIHEAAEELIDLLLLLLMSMGMTG